jgi:sigma-E factor negative regulatory protein RseB
VIKPLLFLLILLLVNGSGASAETIRQDDLNWLKVMAFAAHQTDFSGTFVYQYGDHVETSRITHIADVDGEHGRLESLDGPRREIIRHNDKVWCDIGFGKVRIEQRQDGREFPALLPEQLTLLSKNYVILPAEEVRLAGFHAHAIIFQPKDNLRYLHKMWADSVSGLLLKSEVLDERGSVIEQYSFTQLSIGGNIDRSWIVRDQPPADSMPNDAHHPHNYDQNSHHPHSMNELQPDTIPRSIVNQDRKRLPPAASGWRVDALPAGFKKVAEVSRKLRGRDVPAVQLVFSDGLAGISVFIEKMDNDDDDHPGLSSQGVIQVYSRLLNDQLITVVGEVPPRTVMQVADSVRKGANQP